MFYPFQLFFLLIHPVVRALEHHVDIQILVCIFGNSRRHDDPVGAGISFRVLVQAVHKRMAVLPGFVNAHTHAAMTLVRGLGEESPLMEWLTKKVWPE